MARRPATASSAGANVNLVAVEGGTGAGVSSSSVSAAFPPPSAQARPRTPPPSSSSAGPGGGSGRSGSRPTSRPSSPVPPPSAGSAKGADPKLLHLVRRLVRDDPNLAGNSKAVLDALLERHREYRRKNASVLLGGVQGALNALNQQQGGPLGQQQQARGKGGRPRIGVGLQQGQASKGLTRSGSFNRDGSFASQQGQQGGQPQQPGSRPSSQPSSPVSNKRRREDGDTESSPATPAEQPPSPGNPDGDYDAEASQHDRSVAAFEQNNKVGGSMLNAGLRDRYGAKQKERDIVERKERAEREKKEKERLAKEEKEKKEKDGAKEGDDNKDDAAASAMDQDTSKEGASGDGEARDSLAPLPPSAPTTPAAATPTTKKKKKRSSAKGGALSRSNSLSSPFPSNDGFGPSSDGGNLVQPAPRPKERYSDLGGMPAVLSQLREIVEYPLMHPEVFRHLGVDPPRGVLLRGPPGCGKTHLANAIAGELGECGVNYFCVSAPEMVAGVSGESESRIRDLFRSAARNAPAIVFLDEIDAVAPKRGDGGGGKSMEKRMVAQFLTCLDGLGPDNTRDGAPVLILAATNRPDSIDPALRRAGRFDREITLGVPDERAREGILRVMTKEMRLDGDIDYGLLAKKTPGFVGADVRSLTKEAAVTAINRIFRSLGLASAALPEKTEAATMTDGETSDTTTDAAEKAAASESVTTALQRSPLNPAQLAPHSVTMSDFLAAVPRVQPSSQREGFATVPDVSWSDIGALASVREELALSVLEPISHPERFEELGLTLPAGVLLYGPPGCGKTLLAKAVANESGANFISVKGPELLDKYVGESERAVRVVFDRARSSSPCVVFFDELDSLCPKRGSDSGGGGVSERVVNQLLTEMDGLDSRRSVFVIAATNRPELIDPAMMRPGRLDKLLYVPLPQPEDRVAILKALAVKVKLGEDVDLAELGRSQKAEGYSGADCAALLREAGLAVLRERGALDRQRKALAGYDGDDSNRMDDSPDALPKADKSSEASGDGKGEQQKLRILARHFDYAFEHVMPSVSRRDQARYDRMRDRMARARSRGGAAADAEQQEGDTGSNGKGGGGGAESTASPSGEVKTPAMPGAVGSDCVANEGGEDKSGGEGKAAAPSTAKPDGSALKN